MVGAAFSWKDPDQMFWATGGLWYGSLFMDLTCICLATQQAVAINRVSCYPDKDVKIREMLGVEGTNGIRRPRWSQIFVWQTPVMLMYIGVLLFVAGLVIQFFAGLPSVWSPDNVKVSPCRPSFVKRLAKSFIQAVILFCTLGGVAGLFYLSCFLLLYNQQRFA